MKSTRNILAIVIFAITLMIKLCAIMSICSLHATSEEAELAHEFDDQVHMVKKDKNRLSL